MVGLSSFGERKPTELSGGQQTRVALARALVIKPSLVLLDEPFSNLDEALREEIGDEVVRLLKESGTTTLMVTHDREDALVSADLIALMRDGTVVQTGTPAEVYLKPLSAEVAVSTGDILTIPAQRLDSKTFSSPIHQKPARSRKTGEVGELLIRPEEIRVHAPRHRGAKAVISRVHYYGHDAVLELRVPGLDKDLKVRVAGPLEYAVGDSVSLEHIGPIRWVSRKATRE
jgi:iron(III) transport system ATP-binding protein